VTRNSEFQRFRLSVFQFFSFSVFQFFSFLSEPNVRPHCSAAFETRSLPTLTRSYPRRFAFYVARPARSIQLFSVSAFSL
jgi:hypothetical protein